MHKFLSICIVLLSIFVFLEFLHPIPSTNPDIWTHLLLGKVIIYSHQVPQINLLSYTHPHFPFINSHWLSEVLFYFIFQLGKFNGLIILGAILGTFTYVLLFLFVRKRVSLHSLLIAGIVASLILFERTDIRPELFSFLFLSIFKLHSIATRKKLLHGFFFLFS